MNKLFCTFLGLMAVATFALGQAKDFPQRPIKVIVPFTPGSGSDTTARFFGEQLAGVLGQPFVVENRPGAGGLIGVMAVKAAPADGYTILVGSNSTVALNPIVMKDLPYDPMKDLKPLSGLTRGVTVFIVPVNSKLNTLADIGTAAKKGQKQLNVGNYSMGYQLAAEWLANLTGVKFTSIPYKGAAQMFTDVMGNQLDVAIADRGAVAPLTKGGKLRALAVTGENRHPDFPGVPTVMESGYPDYVYYTWVTFHVRSETPDDVTTKLVDALQKVLATDAAKEYAKKIGAELMPLVPVAMQKWQMDEFERFRRIAEAVGIKAQ